VPAFSTLSSFAFDLPGSNSVSSMIGVLSVFRSCGVASNANASPPLTPSIVKLWVPSAARSYAYALIASLPDSILLPVFVTLSVNHAKVAPASSAALASSDTPL